MQRENLRTLTDANVARTSGAHECAMMTAGEREREREQTLVFRTRLCLYIELLRQESVDT